MVSSKIFISTLLALGASAVPMKSDTEQLDKRCTWNDGHGDIDCAFFSVVFGDGSVLGSKGSVTIKGNGWQAGGNLDCGSDDNWTSFTSQLAFTVDIHGGNACHTTLGGHFDNTWIKYASQYLDVPSDTRCGNVGTLDKSRRCIVPA
ncbi:hypothetical protein ACJ41O_011021 [Fusarium nematophilum]